MTDQTPVNKLTTQHIYPNRQIFLDYLTAAPQLVQFYSHYPANKDTLLKSSQQLTNSSNSRAALSQSLLTYNQSIAASPQTLENARLLAKPDTLAVVTGQQPAFVGGALYNIYKALSAIKLSQHLKQTTGKNVVPIFWIASEDTNLSHITNTSWIDRQGQLQQIHADLPKTTTKAPQQISTLTTSHATLTAFEELFDLLPNSEFRDRWQKLYTPNELEPWSQWFARIYAQLFAEHGLVLLEPHVVYPHASEIFIRALTRLQDLQQAFDKTTTVLTQQGYQPQIAPNSRTMLYKVSQGQRHPIDPSADDYDPAVLLDLAEKHPDHLSCSVALRPVVQDFLLPTVAYVAGPAEVSYFAQLRGIYQLLDVPMPVIWPRASMTLVEPNVARLMKKSNLTIEALLAEAQPPAQTDPNSPTSPTSQLLQNLAQQTNLSLEQLAATLKENDASLTKFTDKISNRIRADIDRLVQRALQCENQHRQITHRQHQRLLDSLKPHSQPQERAFSLLCYLVYYGQAVLDEIRSQLDIFDFRHRVIPLNFNNEKLP